MVNQPPPEFSFELEPDGSQVWNTAIPALGIAAVAIYFIARALGADPSKRAAVVLTLGVCTVVLACVPWLIHRSLKFSRQPLAFVLGADKVSIPALGMFSRSSKVFYGDISRVESVLHGHEQIVWSGGRKKINGFALGKQRAAIRAALRLHVAYSLEQRGELDLALRYFEEASDQFEPPLSARLASAYEASGNEDEAEEHYCSAAIDLELEFGPDHPTVAKLRAQLERLLGYAADQRVNEERALREKLPCRACLFARVAAPPIAGHACLRHYRFHDVSDGCDRGSAAEGALAICRSGRHLVA